MKNALEALVLATAIAMFSTAAFAAACPLPETESGSMPPPPPGAEKPGPNRLRGSFDAMPPGMPGIPGIPGPIAAAIGDLDQLQMLYHLTGSDAELMSVYRDVLKKSQDPLIRQYTYSAIARAQMRPASSVDAIASIRQSLDEDLTRVAKMPAMDAALAHHPTE